MWIDPPAIGGAPDEVILDDAHHGLQVSFNPPPVRIKKPPDKVCQGKQAVNIVVGVLVMRSCLEAFNVGECNYSIVKELNCK